MKDTKELIEKLIDVQTGYCNDRKEIRKYLQDQPVVLAMLESYTERIDQITDIIIEDILEVSDKPSNDKYSEENWSRGLVRDLINCTVKADGKHKNSVIELIVDWENLHDSTSKVEKHTWFHYKELLDEHSQGFPTYQKQLEEAEKEKKKSTKKTTA